MTEASTLMTRTSSSDPPISTLRSRHFLVAAFRPTAC